MKPESDELTGLAVRYQLSQGHEEKQKILEIITPLIKDYPMIKSTVRNYDYNMDFYLFFLERFDKIIADYDKNLCKFQTYLNAVLSNVFKHFGYKKHKKKIDSHTVEDKQLETVAAASSHSAFLKETGADYFVNKTNQSSHREMIEKAFKDFKNEKRYISVRLYFIDFFTDQDFLKLKEISGKSWEECYRFFDEILQDTAEKKERKAALDARLRRLERLVKKEHSLYTEGKSNAEKLKKITERRQKYYTYYHDMNIMPAQHLIADFLSIKRYTLSRDIDKFRQTIKTQMNQPVYQGNL